MSFVRLSAENAMVRQTVRDFVTRELLPYEKVLAQREIAGEHGASPGLSRDERRELQQRGRRSGLWGIDTPEELGGADLPPLTQALTFEELGRTFVDFECGGSALPPLDGCNEERRRDYLLPTIEGERQPCIAISEPGGGSDVRAMRTSARREGDNWVLTSTRSTWRESSTALLTTFCRSMAPSATKECPIERWYRDVRFERICDGSDEVSLRGIARNLFNGNVRAGEIFARR